MSILIIPAAGLATRFRPISNNTSKCMLPINGKPIISHIIDENIDRFEEIRVVVGSNPDTADYLNYRYGPKVKTFIQHNAEGPLHAVSCALTYLDEQRSIGVTIWLGDTIVKKYVPSGSNEIVVGEVDDYCRWCMVDSNGTLYDKPTAVPPTKLALVGIYSFERLDEMSSYVNAIIKSGEKLKGEYQISQLLNKYKFGIVQTTNWYDCGDFPSLYESKARLLQYSTRVDNEISADIEQGTILKSGRRCENEAAWYSSVRENHRNVLPFIPQIYDVGSTYYKIEYCAGNCLQESFIYENMKDDTIEYVIKRVMRAYTSSFMDEPFYNVHSNSFNAMMFEKALSRANEYNYSFISTDSLNKYVSYIKETMEDMDEYIPTYSGIIHGDFHFGNIMFDFNTGKVKFIDPRGEWNNERTTGGAIDYDLVKLYQSVVGEYIWIKTDTAVDNNKKRVIIDILDNLVDDLGFEPDALKRMVPILMGSCIPFHDDCAEHQKRIWSVTMRLIDEYRVC